MIIVGIDLSFRNTGVARIRRDDDGSINVLDYKVIPIEKPSKKVKGVDRIHFEQKNFMHLLRELYAACLTADKIVIESPFGSQNARSAYAIGFCHAAIGKLCYMYGDKVEVISPYVLKKWSSSQAGDKKDKVREKVYEHVGFEISKNDNIIDALAICLLSA